MPSWKTILLIRSRHDLVTNYLYFWSEPLVKIIEKKGAKLVDLKDSKANKDNLKSYLSNKNISLLVFNGHGNRSTIYGFNNQILVRDGEDNSCFGDTVVYARSCQAGQILGKSLVKSGTKAFIGYDRDFVFRYLREFISDPASDPIARMFLEPSNLIISTLTKGHTAKNAYVRSINSMKKNLLYSLSSEANHEEKLCAQYLWSNIQGQVLLGNTEARI